MLRLWIRTRSSPARHTPQRWPSPPRPRAGGRRRNGKGGGTARRFYGKKRRSQIRKPRTSDTIIIERPSSSTTISTSERFTRRALERETSAGRRRFKIPRKQGDFRCARGRLEGATGRCMTRMSCWSVGLRGQASAARGWTRSISLRCLARRRCRPRRTREERRCASRAERSTTHPYRPSHPPCRRRRRLDRAGATPACRRSRSRPC